MKLKINKACDLSSISVLPPQSRRRSSAGGLESSTIFGRSQTASQLRPQQSQQSQLSVSQGVSSQHGLFSQFSQNSQDEVLTNEAKIGSQERENSVRRTSCLPPINYTREESQMVVSRSSSNLMRKWSGQEHKCQISEELEHKIGMIETSLSRIGMILDSVQSDIMQVNKGTKEVALEMEGARQKLIVHDDSLQSLNKGQEDIKTRLDMGLKSMSDQLKQNLNGENLSQIFSMLSALPDKIDSQILQLQNDLHKDFSKELQVLACSMEISKLKQATPPMHGHKAASCDAPPKQLQFPNNTTRQMKTQQASLLPKVETGGWTSVKQERAISKAGNLNKKSNQIMSSNRLERVVIESDEEIDDFSCLLKDKGTEIDYYSVEKAEEETARILRKARRRKRKYCNTIIIN